MSARAVRIFRNAMWFGAVAQLLLAIGFSRRFAALPTGAHVAQFVPAIIFAVVLWRTLPRTSIALPLAPVSTAAEAQQLGGLVAVSVACIAARHFHQTGNVFFFAQVGVTLGVARRLLGAWRHAIWWTLGATYCYGLGTPSDAIMLLIIGAVAAFVATMVVNQRWRPRLAYAVALVVGAEAVYSAALFAVGLPFGVAAVVVAALIASIFLIGRRLAKPEDTALRIARVVAVGVASLACAGAVGAVFLGWASVSGYVNRSLLDSGDPALAYAGGAPLPAVNLDDPQRLATAFVPVMAFAGDERWFPSRVESYLQDAVVREPGGRVDRASAITDPSSRASRACRKDRECKVILARCSLDGSSGSCPDTSCRELACMAPCRMPSLACAAARPGDGADPVVYAHLVRDPLGAAGIPAGKRAGLPAPLRGLSAVLQYWVFYRYDDWHAWPHAEFRQWHDGDWESVSIGLGSGGPLFAAFSSHCGGSWVQWSSLDTTPAVTDSSGHVEPPPSSTAAAQSHLVVYVGRGSHAMYPLSAPRAPDWATCKKTSALVWIASWGPSQSLAVTETMPSKKSHILIGPRAVVIDDQTPWLLYRGWWSSGDHMAILPKLPGGRHDCAERCSGGPDAPSAKPEWRDPVGVIFCASRWRPGSRASLLRRIVGPGRGGCHRAALT